MSATELKNNQTSDRPIVDSDDIHAVSCGQFVRQPGATQTVNSQLQSDNKMLLKCSSLEPGKGKGKLTRASTGKSQFCNAF